MINCNHLIYHTENILLGIQVSGESSINLIQVGRKFGPCPTSADLRKERRQAFLLHLPDQVLALVQSVDKSQGRVVITDSSCSFDILAQAGPEEKFR
jgi:hypothetical protein